MPVRIIITIGSGIDFSGEQVLFTGEMGTTAIGFIDKVCVQSCIVLQCVPLPSNPALSTNERPVPNISLSHRNSDAYHRMNHELFRPSIWSRNIWVKWKPPSKSNCLHKSRRSISCNDFLPFGSKYCHARLQVPTPTVTPAYQKRIGQLSFMVEHVASHMANLLRIFINFQCLVHKTQKIRRNDQIVFQDDHPVVRLQNRSHPAITLAASPCSPVAPRHSTV